MTFTLLERRVLAVGTVIVLHAVLVGIAAAAQAIVAGVGSVRALPREPLLVTAVALLMAHCSLGAFWWARSTWAYFAKTLVVVLTTALIWFLLVGVLQATSMAESAAVGWAASLASQAILAGVGAAVVQLLKQPHVSPIQTRFTIMSLLLWMAVVAVVLGAGRALAEAFGWTLENVLAWEFLYQLQWIATANGILALGLLISLQAVRSWSVRVSAAGCALVVIALAAPAVISLMFTNVGATYADMVWLLAAEGLFLLATLIPLEAAKVQTSS